MEQYVNLLRITATSILNQFKNISFKKGIKKIVSQVTYLFNHIIIIICVLTFRQSNFNMASNELTIADNLSYTCLLAIGHAHFTMVHENTKTM